MRPSAFSAQERQTIEQQQRAARIEADRARQEQETRSARLRGVTTRLAVEAEQTGKDAAKYESAARELEARDKQAGARCYHSPACGPQSCGRRCSVQGKLQGGRAADPALEQELERTLRAAEESRSQEAKLRDTIRRLEENLGSMERDKADKARGR